MDLHTPEAVAARVVAWHNRHPLARRITAAQVHSIGIVALPVAIGPHEAAPAVGPHDAPHIEPAFDAPATSADGAPPASANADGAPAAAAASPSADPSATPAAAASAATATATGLRQRLAGLAAGWQSRAAGWWHAHRPGATLRPAPFSEDFAPPLRPVRIARFAAVHAAEMASLPPDWPRRDVPADSATPSAAAVPPIETRGLITAAVDASDATGPRRLRLLLGPTDGQVLGTRAWSRPRVASAAGLATTAALTAVAVLAWPAATPESPGLADGAAIDTVAAAKSPAPAKPAGLEAAASAPVAHASAAASAASASAVANASGETAHAAVAAPQSASASVASALDTAGGEALPIDLRPRLADAARQAAEKEAAAARAAGLEPVPERAARLPAPPPTEPMTAAAAADGGRLAATRPGPLGAATPVTPERAAAATASAPTATRAAGHAAPARRHLAVLAPLADDRAQANGLRASMLAVAANMEHDGPPLQAEVYNTPQGLQAALWPFISEADAERARAALARRGVRTIVLDF